MKIAILDLGTNTFHLLIAEVYLDKTFKIIFKTRAVVKLGKDGFNRNEISDERFKIGLHAILRFQKLISKHKVSKVLALATSAIRKSNNGKEFIRQVKKLTGIQIKAITGDKEAELIYYGIRQCIRLDESPVLVMDIGGGSTEFIIANHSTIFWKQSFDIGAARLLEKFNPSNPLTSKESAGITSYIKKSLKPLERAISKYPVTKLIGSSGSFETLAEMIGYRFYKRNIIKSKTNYQFKLNEYRKVHAWLMKSTLARRLKSKGLVKMRADMIVLSSICTNYVLEKFNMEEMELSKFALKEGALWKII